MKKFIFVTLILLVIVGACVPAASESGVSQEELDLVVQATFQALTQQVEQNSQPEQPVQANQPEQPAQEPSQPNQAPGQISNGRTDGTGSISGNLSFPSEGIPPLYVVAFNTGSGFYYWVGTAPNQTSYQIDFLPPGSYHVVAYTQGDQPFGGAYDQAVLCGLNQNCTDYSLVTVNVQAGFVTTNINPGDWYTGPENYPARPDFGPQQETGSISGKLSYPSEGVPPLYVVAYNAADMSQYYYVATKQGELTYKIENLPPDISYFVVAYVQTTTTISGGYSKAVPCGLQVGCDDHSLIPIFLNSGAEFSNADPGDWYAGLGVFPTFPGP